MIKNENCSVLMMSDATGEGIMTVYRVMPGVFSIMQENELRLDNRENHKGTTYYPLKVEKLYIKERNFQARPERSCLVW